MPINTTSLQLQVKDFYNEMAQAFSQTRQKKLWAEVIPFVRLIKTGMRVLDVGCGNGRLLSEIQARKVYYTGLDFSQSLIAKAKKKYTHRRFLVRDVTKASGWQGIGQYHMLFCLGVLHHIPDRRSQHELLKQMYRHTRSGGSVLITVWNLWHYRFWRYHIQHLARKLRYKDLSFVWIPFSVSNGKKAVATRERFCKAYWPRELITLAKQVGFVVDTFYFASNGKTHLSRFTGNNFCLYVRKRV